MKIILAEALGMCFGVRDALAAMRRIEQPVHVTVLGELVHNRAVNDEVRSRGLDLDEGMAVMFQGRLYHGAGAMNMLAILGSDGGIFNRVNGALFRHPRLARLLYPVLVRGRWIALRLLGRRLIADGRKGR